MSVETLLLLIIILILAGAVPAWPHSKSWGFAPMGVLTVVLIIFVAWAILEERPLFRSSGPSLGDSVEEAGQDLKAAGRDVADSIRDTVQ